VKDEKESYQIALTEARWPKLFDLAPSHTVTSDRNKVPPDLEEDEPENLCCLREAALTTIAVPALVENDVR
jgi:hypothetical protein